MIRVARLVMLLLLTTVAVAAPMLSAGNAGLTAPQLAQYNSLIQELRCLVCQNQSLAESNADLAIDLRQKVRLQVLAGKSNDEIIAYFVARYGEFVHYRPSFAAINALLWLGPIFFVILGAVGYQHYLKRRHLQSRDGNGAVARSANRAVARSANRAWPLFIFIITLIAVLLLYANVGDYQRAREWQSLQLANKFYEEQSQSFAGKLANADNDAKSVSILVAEFKNMLQARLRLHPDEVTGWYLLGQVAQGAGDYKLAKQSLAKAHALAPDDGEIAALYARVDYLRAP